MSRKKKIMQQRLKEEAARKAVKRQKRGVIIMAVAAGIICGVIAGAVIFDTIKEKETVIDYSAGLSEDGCVKGANVTKDVTLADMSAVSTDYHDYLPDKETEDTYIDAMLESYLLLDDKAGVEVKEGDTISIDYVGYVDGVEYEGGNTNKAGIRMTVGSEGYPGDFEQQIIGHKTGETFDVEIDFEDDFANETLAGKHVVYNLTINGMLSKGTFNDEFVEKNFGSYVSSADEFLEMYRKSVAESNFDETLLKYLEENSTVENIPENYLKKLQTIEKNKDEKQLQTTNDAYLNMYGSAAFKDIYEMKKMDAKQYENDVVTRAENNAKKAMIIQAAMEQFNLSVSEEKVNDVLSSYAYEENEYDEAVERFGEPYIYQMAMEKEVEAYLKENYSLSE